MLKENDLASMYEEHDDHSSRIVAFLQEISNENCGAFLEVEVREEKEAIMAAAAWAQRQDEGKPKLVIMLDNFGPERSRDVASQLTEMGLREHVYLEASGGIVFSQLDEWQESGIDVLSTSAVNRGVPSTRFIDDCRRCLRESHDQNRGRSFSPKVSVSTA